MTAPWSQEAQRRQGIWEIGPISGKMQTKEKTKSKTCNTFLRLLQKEDRTNLSKPCYISMGKLKKMYIFCTAPTPPPSPTQSETCFSCFLWDLRFSFSCLPSCVSLSYLCLISRVCWYKVWPCAIPNLALTIMSVLSLKGGKHQRNATITFCNGRAIFLSLRLRQLK